MGTPVRIVGCGRWAMGDDQVGLIVAERLRECNLPDTTVALDEAPGCGLADETLQDADLLIVVDAAQADEDHPTGSCQRIDYRQRPAILSADSKDNTHTLGVSAGLELAAVLGILPPHVWVYVIFGEDFERRLTVGDTVSAGVRSLATRIEHDVTEWVETRSCTS